MACYIIGGSTSNLAFALIPLLLARGVTLYATHNTGPDIAPDVTYVTHDEGLRMAQDKELRCALWLAPVKNVAVVSQFARQVPTLAISSMALAEHFTKGTPFHRLDDRQQSEYVMFGIAGLNTIASGIFIDDSDSDDTMRELLRPAGAPFVSTTFSYNKPPMAVTLKNKLAAVIAAWVANPDVVKPNRFTVLCTDAEYSRAHLRLLALGEYAPAPGPGAAPHSALDRPMVGGVEQRVEHEEVAAALRTGYAKRQKVAAAVLDAE